MTEYNNKRLIGTPYCLFSAYSNYCNCLWLCGLTLISIPIVKTIMRPFYKRFLLVSQEKVFICLITFESNLVLDSLKPTDHNKFQTLEIQNNHSSYEQISTGTIQSYNRINPLLV